MLTVDHQALVGTLRAAKKRKVIKYGIFLIILIIFHIIHCSYNLACLIKMEKCCFRAPTIRCVDKIQS